MGLQGLDSIIELSGEKNVNTHNLEFTNGLWWKDGQIAILSMPACNDTSLKHEKDTVGNVPKCPKLKHKRQFESELELAKFQ
jgi:predicted Zn-ribbon and HTH transcriptional regulator